MIAELSQRDLQRFQFLPPSPDIGRELSLGLVNFEGEKLYSLTDLAAIQGLRWGILYGHDRAQDLTPISLDDALALHDLVSHLYSSLTPERSINPGELRNKRVQVQGSPLIPPFPDENPEDYNVVNLVERLFVRLKEQSPKDAFNVYRIAAWFHLNYEGIHPFNDFNGRTGRVLTDIILQQFGFRPVTNWQTEVSRRAGDDRNKHTFEEDYILSIRKSERLKFNRWHKVFGNIRLPDYLEGKAPALGSIEDDYLLPLEIFMIKSGLSNESLLLNSLQDGGATLSEVTDQVEKVDSLTAILNEKARKFGIIQKYAYNSMVDFDLPRKTFPGQPHSHPLWKRFVSPEES